MASASGNTVPAIAKLVATSDDRVRQMVHPFTRWSLRKLAAYLADNPGRVVQVRRERLRQILGANDVAFQRTKTWKESNDCDRDAKLGRIEEVINTWPDRCFAFDEFGPLTIGPVSGSCWSPASEPQRVPANYNKLHGVRQFHGCYSIGDDTLWGVVRRRKSAANVLAALKSIRAARPDRDQIYVILDNLSEHKGTKIRSWAENHRVIRKVRGDRRIAEQRYLSPVVDTLADLQADSRQRDPAR